MRSCRTISAVDVHAEGEPGRVITGGVLDVPGATMFEKMGWLRDNGDELRQWMLREPRGYPAMCCNVLLPPTVAQADAGYVIMEQSEYPAMSGSNTICVVTVLIETGMVKVEEPITRLCLETPAGLVHVVAAVADGRCVSVEFENVPAFAALLDQPLEVPEIGTVRVDVAWGGMYYVIAAGDELGVQIRPKQAAELARLGEMLRQAAAEQLDVVHPQNPAIRGVSIAQIAGPLEVDASGIKTSRNAVVVSTGKVDWRDPQTWRGVLDRSPCGTGTCARMAVSHAKGELEIGERFIHESIIGTKFEGKLLREQKLGSQAAVVPSLSGRAWITGFANYVLDPQDPFPRGFRVGDLWGESE